MSRTVMAPHLRVAQLRSASRSGLPTLRERTIGQRVIPRDPRRGSPGGASGGAMTESAYLTSDTPGPDQWRWSLLPGQHVLTIGRSPATDIQLAGDERISREHARLAWNGYQWTIADSLSGNGTFVNGRRPTH